MIRLAEKFRRYATVCCGFRRLTLRKYWKRALLRWFGFGSWPDGDPHFHVLLIVPAKCFGAGSPFYVAQAEWRVIWEQCLRADGQRIVDIKVTKNLGEVAKYATEPDAYLKLDGEECAIRTGIKRCNSCSAAGG